MFIISIDDVHLLRELPEGQQQVLMAARGMDKPSYRKIAFELSIPDGTVKSRINRARANLSRLKAAQAANSPQAALSEVG